MKRLLISLFAFALPGVMIAQKLPSEQFVLWKVWSSDSSALKNLGYGDFVFSDRDTVVLEGSDSDTVLFEISHARGYFNVWIIPDTANFPVQGTSHDHALGETDSLTLTYKPKLQSALATANPGIDLKYLNELDWNAEKVYYEAITPPLAKYLEFYISHTGSGDTSAVIIELQWQ
jgi:hypothetical protein